MNEFMYSYPTKVYFGEQAAQKALKAELESVGKTIMVAYGGGSVRRAQSAVYHDGSGETGDFRRV